MIFEDRKWLGLRWEEIDDNLVIRHPPSWGGEIIERSMRGAGLVEKNWLACENCGGSLPKRGPVIMCDTTGRPWSQSEFNFWWRRIADAAGIPKSVKNRNSRKSVLDERVTKKRSVASEGLSEAH